MGVQVRLEALKLAVSMRGLTEEFKVISVAAAFEAFMNTGVVPLTPDVVKIEALQSNHRGLKKGRR